jgi:NTE family protein
MMKFGLQSHAERKRLPRHFVAVAYAALLVVVALSAACATPLRKPATVAPPPAGAAEEKPATRAVAGRPSVGVAFGGGSARGLAHVGVLRWFEEHRIPIDLAAGTSMGGLIGGAFASGMTADEITRMLDSIDWDEMFGTTVFKYKNIRRKADARDYPSRLEFGLKGGIVPPTALNNGQQVEQLLAGIGASWYDVKSFDELPTPFRCVAVDLLSASEVVLDRGSLAQAMRATMSLPLIFPPVEADGRVLVDGGIMNNVPANVVRAMGADRVVAINVGDLAEQEALAYTLTGLAGAAFDAVMRASSKEVLRSADVVINVPLKKYGSLDWRRSGDLSREGYDAAEAMRDRLLPLAVSEDVYERWRQDRQSRRRSQLPRPAFVRVEGFESADTRRLTTVFSRHVNTDLDIKALETEITEVLGLDRYEAINWRLTLDDAGRTGLLIVGRPKPFAPPFMMLGLNLENTTSSDFQISLTARYLAYGLVTSGSEVRIGGTLGSNPAAGVELYQPLASSPFFVASSAGVIDRAERILADDQIVARYGVLTSRVGLEGGVNLARESDVRVGAYWGRVNARVEVGDPGLPELKGSETGAALRWRYDGQDSPVVPTGGLAALARLERVFNGPDGVIDGQTIPLDGRVTQFEVKGSQFYSLGDSNRVFVGAGIGTSFNGTALPTNVYTLGGPLRLGAYPAGELRGQHYYTVTAGYLRQVARLPDFLGGSVFAGGWLDHGDAFDDWDQVAWRANPGVGVVMDTLIGPVILAGSAGFDGRWRMYVGVGRIFR